MIISEVKNEHAKEEKIMKMSEKRIKSLELLFNYAEDSDRFETLEAWWVVENGQKVRFESINLITGEVDKQRVYRSLYNSKG